LGLFVGFCGRVWDEFDWCLGLRSCGCKMGSGSNEWEWNLVNTSEVTDAEQPERAPRETENRRLIHRHCQEERACDLD
jgi:hypothetical protein